MNYLIFCFYVFTICHPDSPYFYNKELNEMCLENFTRNIGEKFDLINCIAVDKELKDRSNRLVFICFYGNDEHTYFYYTKIKPGKSAKLSKKINESNIEEIVTEIIKNIEKECSVIEVHIYFTVEFRTDNIEFFNKKNSKNSIDLIQRSFQKQLGSNSSVVYYPYLSWNYLFGTSLEGSSTTKMIKLVDCGIDYYVFFDKDLIKDHIKQAEHLVKQYEEKIIEELKCSFYARYINEKRVDTIILATLYKMDGSLTNNISNSQANFLLKIWKFLKNKRRFYKAFIEIFKNKCTVKDERELDEILKCHLEENKDFYVRKGLINRLSRIKPQYKAVKYYLVMNRMGEDLLDENTRVFISKTFSILSKDLKSLSDVILFINNYKRITEFDNLRNDIFTSYENFINEEIFSKINNYFESRDTLKEENTLFENLFQKCRENILKNKNDISVFKKIHENIFRKI